MTQTTDGFTIAEKDLLLRGPGDFLGTRQHGDVGSGAFIGAMDGRTLELAGRAAREILASPGEDGARLIEMANERFDSMFGSIAMN